jgi:flagellar hook assembly protein FlgD
VNYNTSEFCNNFTVPTAVEEETSTEKPLRCKLTQNLPNPFSSSTKIQYSLPKTTYMTLKIYDVSGKLVKILAEGTYTPFHYIVYWDGKDIMGRNVSPGVYFCKLVTADFNATTKLILTK